MCKFKKGDVVLVRDSDDMFWKITAFLEKTDDGWYRGSVTSLESDSMLYRQCIPYDNEIIEKQKDINKRWKLDWECPSYNECAESSLWFLKVYNS